jgi:hypothetical protein
MIVMRMKHTPQAAAGDGDGGGGLNIQPDADDGEDGGGSTVVDPDADPDAGPVDRGDELDPALNPAAVAKVAAGAGAEDDDDGAAAAAAGAGKKGAQSVPIARLNEVIEQRNALKAENEALKAGGKASTGAAAQPAAEVKEVPAFDVNKAEREYAEFLADGEFDKAVALRGQINAVLIEQAEINVETRQAQRTVQSSLSEVANQAVVDWPYLDTEDGADVMGMIIAARDAGVRKGLAMPDALKAAVDRIAPKFAPEGDGTPGKELQDGRPRVDTRPQGANARGAADSGQQPPIAAGAGNRAAAGKVDVENMSEAQFDALTPAEKKRLRGDA